MTLDWKPEYSVGDASIDHEHQQMIEDINHLSQLLEGTVEAEQIQNILGEIHAAISAHFALEEHLMRNAHYTGYPEHKADHEDLLEQIHDLMDSFYQHPDSGRELLKSRLSNWFGQHFGSFDAALHNRLK